MSESTRKLLISAGITFVSTLIVAAAPMLGDANMSVATFFAVITTATRVAVAATFRALIADY